ncbi:MULTISPECIES: hypothetical protein [Lachnospiraceae]|jgi:hypothetical protein|uniref:Nif11 domain-containing protein n=1 Tax=Faecalicatena acetigenes TaxID=2981790 RepID=A0ABT2TAX0_9FIRM|nr:MULTISPECIES: hypothetical protein [Lachnospiraceae]MCU6747423.1 hypothetical protein [Faecalicatena acetigenes]RGT73357.1 hypothetical protein DWX08_06695 [Ruminococcus sp. AF18-22]SCH86817.1 Uncharacterised protein [uncultured Clostridium sp.]
MKEIPIVLEELQRLAMRDETVRQRFLKTREETDPVSAFCGLCRDMGYELYEMELICAGEEFYANMKRSTNGGGENSPVLAGADDFYEMFFANISKKSSRS